MHNKADFAGGAAGGDEDEAGWESGGGRSGGGRRVGVGGVGCGIGGGAPDDVGLDLVKDLLPFGFDPIGVAEEEVAVDRGGGEEVGQEMNWVTLDEQNF